MICRVYTRFGAFALWMSSIVSLHYGPFFTRCKAECEAFLWSIKCHFLLMRVELIQCPNVYISKNFRPFLCEMPVCHKSSQPTIVSYWMNKENNKQWKCGVCYFSDRCDGCVEDWDKSLWFHTQIHPSLIQTLCVEVGTKTSESRLHYTRTSLWPCFTCGFIFYECLSFCF